jgi:hypothetical protein
MKKCVRHTNRASPDFVVLALKSTSAEGAAEGSQERGAAQSPMHSTSTKGAAEDSQGASAAQSPVHHSTSAEGAAEGSQGRARFAPPLGHVAKNLRALKGRQKSFLVDRIPATLYEPQTHFELGAQGGWAEEV